MNFDCEECNKLREELAAAVREIMALEKEVKSNKEYLHGFKDGTQNSLRLVEENVNLVKEQLAKHLGYKL